MAVYMPFGLSIIVSFPSMAKAKRTKDTNQLAKSTEDIGTEEVPTVHLDQAAIKAASVVLGRAGKKGGPVRV